MALAIELKVVDKIVFMQVYVYLGL